MPFKLSEETVDALLDKLSSDDDFRDTFLKNPRKALAAVGHKQAANPKIERGAWTCLNMQRLADKATIKATRDTLRKQLLTSQAGHSPISLEASRR